MAKNLPHICLFAAPNQTLLTPMIFDKEHRHRQSVTSHHFFLGFISLVLFSPLAKHVVRRHNYLQQHGVVHHPDLLFYLFICLLVHLLVLPHSCPLPCPLSPPLLTQQPPPSCLQHHTQQPQPPFNYHLNILIHTLSIFYSSLSSIISSTTTLIEIHHHLNNHQQNSK